jgi:alkanesulfonate monooxygenase SsuD/methylene tetrahydromethanopterin reductase-like flavin-dependent oxidoreductase (luciferase family)
VAVAPASISCPGSVERIGNPPANVGKNPVPQSNEIYARAEEFTQLLYGLLYSWDRDFLLDDKAGGEFVKSSSFRPQQFKGEFFEVAGALNVAAPIQGRIPNFHVGYSEQSLTYGARHAQARFSPLHDISQGKEAYRSHKKRVASFGGDPDKFKVIPGVLVYPGATQAEAIAKFRQIEAFWTEAVFPRGLSEALNVDLSTVSLDEKVFNVVDFESIAAVSLDGVLDQDKNTTHIQNRSCMPEYPDGDFKTYLREWVLNVFDPDDLTFKDLIVLRWKPYFPLLVGDARKIADWLEEQLEEQLEEETLDGVQLFPPYHRGPVHLFTDLVVPELQRRGIYRTAYEANTFEKNLGTAV